MACLAVALLAQLLLPAVHAVVHALEHGAGQGHGHRHGEDEGERAWVIAKAGGRVVASPSAREGEHRHGALVHHHDAAARPAPSAGPRPGAPAPQGAALAAPAGEHGAPGHHHGGDQPGDRHGSRSLEHLTAFFLEATPPALAVPCRRVAPTAVPLVDGRVVIAPIDRAAPVRGPPRAS